MMKKPSLGKFKFNINTEVTKVLLLPLVPKGVFPRNPLIKPLSHRNFAMKFAPYMNGLLKSHNSAKPILKCCSGSKWRPNNSFFFFILRHFDFGQILKNHFPKGIFQWNSAQRRRIWIYIYIYITEITFLKKLFRFKMVAKTTFWYCAIVLIYAN